ncbi:hypothetical protein SNEBB_005063 [Seison nebaliae]|nr:hypothetical protein SNEBB_005063 [Seison nebaliae]
MPIKTEGSETDDNISNLINNTTIDEVQSEILKRITEIVDPNKQRAAYQDRIDLTNHFISKLKNRILENLNTIDNALPKNGLGGLNQIISIELSKNEIQTDLVSDLVKIIENYLNSFV